MNQALATNLAFWAVAIAFPYAIRLLPTGSGEPPKFFEFFVPMFQIMLAFAATYAVKVAVEKKPAA